ncbi:MAG: hypothetical protein KY464_16560, partial [Gemmatimonadetes bacterium]|nr:hypothetical protein [Gemmatimonadota bacterium]
MTQSTRDRPLRDGAGDAPAAAPPPPDLGVLHEAYCLPTLQSRKVTHEELWTVLEAISEDSPDVVMTEIGRVFEIDFDVNHYQALLVDGDDRAGQLPASGEERELVCDPHLDPQLWGPFHIWLERVIDWQVARRSMVTLKGGAVTLSRGTIAIAAFQGSGKSSTILSLLPEATAYLAEDRLTLFEGAGGRTSVAAFPVPIRLSRGRHYQLPRDVLDQGLGAFDRRLL